MCESIVFTMSFWMVGPAPISKIEELKRFLLLSHFAEYKVVNVTITDPQISALLLASRYTFTFYGQTTTIVHLYPFQF